MDTAEASSPPAGVESAAGSRPSASNGGKRSQLRSYLAGFALIPLATWRRRGTVGRLSVPALPRTNVLLLQLPFRRRALSPSNQRCLWILLALVVVLGTLATFGWSGRRLELIPLSLTRNATDTSLLPPPPSLHHPSSHHDLPNEKIDAELLKVLGFTYPPLDVVPSALLFTVILTTAAVLFVPISAFNILGGVLFSPLWVAIAVNIVATTFASVVCLFVGRWLLRGRILRMLGVDEFHQPGVHTAGSDTQPAPLSVHTESLRPHSAAFDDENVPILGSSESRDEDLPSNPQILDAAASSSRDSFGDIDAQTRAGGPSKTRRRWISFPWGKHKGLDAATQANERRRKLYRQFIAVDKAVTENAFSSLLLLRLTPFVPFPLLNYILSLTNVPLSTYLLTTLFGVSPYMVAMSLVGHLTRLGNRPDPDGDDSPAWQKVRPVVAFVGLSLLPLTIVCVALFLRKAYRETPAPDVEEPGDDDGLVQSAFAAPTKGGDLQGRKGGYTASELIVLRTAVAVTLVVVICGTVYIVED